MPLISCFRRWSIIAAVAGLLIWSVPACAQSSGTFVKDLLASLDRPVDTNGQRVRWGKRIDQLISSPSWESENGEACKASGIRLPLVAGYDAMRRMRNFHRTLDEPVNLFPGRNSLDLLGKDLVRVVSLAPGGLIAARSGKTLLDVSSGIMSVGSLSLNATNLYSRLEIQVNRSKFTLRLLGYKPDGEKRILFTCRTGLGSSEFPTPRGSYYITRIFDDHPLWIPPPDRPWAWGQSPSHTVYGGHMMPFFTKKALHAHKKAEVIRNLDCIADQQEMVDSGAYRIHGTNSPWSVGYAQSHGCVRLLNSSVKQLADLIKTYAGTTTRGRTANGSFVKLARPVRLILF